MHVRLAPWALARGVTAALLAGCCVLPGCGAPADSTVTVGWTIEPTPAVAGAEILVRCVVQHAGKPVTGARLQLEAHMTHPGMAPVTGAVIERTAGSYEARIHLSMAGDWILVMTGALADGSRITKETRMTVARPPG
jgi:hypothetical protein